MCSRLLLRRTSKRWGEPRQVGYVAKKAVYIMAPHPVTEESEFRTHQEMVQRRSPQEAQTTRTMGVHRLRVRYR